MKNGPRQAQTGSKTLKTTASGSRDLLCPIACVPDKQPKDGRPMTSLPHVSPQPSLTSSVGRGCIPGKSGVMCHARPSARTSSLRRAKGMPQSAWLILAVLFAAGVASAPLLAEEPEVNENELRSLLQRNFDASNAENLEALMETIHSDAPGRKSFPREVADVFKHTDIYTRLDEFKLKRVDFKGTYAEARVVQTTVPKNEKDRQSGNVHFQTNSAMLPKHETVWYQMAFQREANGEWKIYKMVWKPEPLPLREGDTKESTAIEKRDDRPAKPRGPSR